jgi:hypothetical protein
LFILTASNPNISSGIFSAIIGGSIMMTFVILFASEVKRLADERPNHR